MIGYGLQKHLTSYDYVVLILVRDNHVGTYIIRNG